jgi:hypothetical protein
VFTTTKGGNYHYLIVSPQGAATIRQVMTDLAMELSKRSSRISD